MNPITFAMLATLTLGACFMRYLSYRIRLERLHAREKIVADAIVMGLHEKPASSIGDGFIFCSLWRLSDIIRIARQAGYELTTADCYTIIGQIKRDHDKTQGINVGVIRFAIEIYVATRMELKFDQPLGI